ncbi:GDSL-type esterase/lipase family protein [Streptomyces filamentosus]|uniref:GDSL-type esterase/lipase family protein n=1 Tax=Streptomyces filamentosus TaxID=67294 RepID=UPI001672AE2A|nr:endonuclease/exonuclease/phosphatase family protein [Streptomyces filamentosus]
MNRRRARPPRVLLLTLVLALFSGLFVGVGSGPAAAAGEIEAWSVSHFRSATYNIRNSNQPHRWEEIAGLVARNDVVALQEVRDDPYRGDANGANGFEDERVLGEWQSTQGRWVRLLSYTWTPPGGRQVFVYKLTNIRQQRAVALIVRAPIPTDDFFLVPEVADDVASKAMLGAIVPNAAGHEGIFFSAHALNGGGDVGDLVRTASGAANGRPWAVMGDFNTIPTWDNQLPPGARFVTSGNPTYHCGVGGQRRNEYDYMVTNDQGPLTATANPGTSNSPSDHCTVEFEPVPVCAAFGVRGADAPCVPPAPDAARSTGVSFVNRTGCDLTLEFHALSHGIWSAAPPELILREQGAAWASESSGLATGTEGTVRYVTQNCLEPSDGNRQIQLHWNNPFIGSNGYDENGSDFSTFRVERQGGAGNNATVIWTARQKPTAVVAMGDSYISGEAGRWAGNANTGNAGSAWGTDRAASGCNADESSCRPDLEEVYGHTSYDGGNRCDRSDVSEIAGAEIDGIPPERRFNLACSGATTDHVLRSGFKGERPQVEQLKDLARHYRVRTIVLSVGGNDLDFSGIVSGCAQRFLSGFGACRSGQDSAFRSKLTGVEDKVVETMNGIHSAMRSQGYDSRYYRLVAQSYAGPIARSADMRYPTESYERYTSGGCPFYDEDATWARDEVIPAISTMIRSAARRGDAFFLDVQDALAGHELCHKGAEQATAAHTLTSPLPAAKAEWVRWVPYLLLPWGSQGDQQEAVHPNAYGQKALSGCLTQASGQIGIGGREFRCTSTAGSAQPSVQTVEYDIRASANLHKENRRTGLGGDLPDWSKAGYRGGELLPLVVRLGNPRCAITPEELAEQYDVKSDDGQDDTAGIQKAIDYIRTSCTPYASRNNLSLIELPRGTVEVSKQVSVDASYLVIRGRGTTPGTGTKIVFRPDAATRYDTLYQGSRWDQDAMRYECPGKLGGSITGTGGWIWPGRALFRVQTREVSAKHQRMCGDISSIPENRRDLFEGSVNQHWESGVTLVENPATPGYAARQGDTTIPLSGSADMSAFKPGGYLWVGAANSVAFYDSQGIGVTGMSGEKENLHMRQQVFVISSVDSAARTVTIDKPLEFDVPVNSVSDGSPPIDNTIYPSKVTPLKMITDVGFENFTFTQQIDGLSAECAAPAPNCATHNYGNLAPEAAMHGIVFKWAANSWVRGTRGEMTGSHPVVTEVAKNLQIQDNYFDGAWNKGKGGNGYLRGSRVWDSLYAFNTTRNLRHFTFQWSASGNVVFANDFDSDLNLHGGWERRNLFDNNTVHVPYNHSSGSCTVNCGGEGGVGDKGTWWPIYWSAGYKASKWSGSSGPQNVFFNNDLTKQTVKNGPYQPYQSYSTRGRVYQFGSVEGSPQSFKPLDYGTGDPNPIPDWAGEENRDYTGGLGVDGSHRDGGDSLFVKTYRP